MLVLEMFSQCLLKKGSFVSLNITYSHVQLHRFETTKASKKTQRAQRIL